MKEDQEIQIFSLANKTSIGINMYKSKQNRLMLVEPLFAVPSICDELDINETDSLAMIKYLTNNEEWYGPPGNTPGIWQTLNRDLHKLEIFKSLLETILDYANRMLYETHRKANDLYILNMWANRSIGYGTIQPHRHPNSMISGVFYLKVSENAGKTAFLNDNVSDFQPEIEYHQDVLQLNNDQALPYWSDQNIVSKCTNTLVLFPSYLKHFVVESNNDAEERITISFNILDKVLGDKHSLSYVETAN